VGCEESWLTIDERTSLQTGIASLRTAIGQENATAIRSAAEELDRLSAPLAARRMDEAIRRSLTGRTLADFA
jgi:hypothetical protein